MAGDGLHRLRFKSWKKSVIFNRYVTFISYGGYCMVDFEYLKMAS